MAVSADFRPIFDGRRYTELPGGLRPWWSVMSDIGDGTGGGMTLTTSFNQALDEAFMPYISVDYFAFFCTVAAMTNMRMFAQASEWERTRDGNAYMGPVVTPVAVETSVILQGQAHFYPIYVGRAINGTAARIFVTGNNIDTSAVVCRIGGFAADFPFVAQQQWRS